MTAKQKKYFAPRKKKVYAMARRRGGYRRSFRRFASRGGGLKGMFTPVLAGVADSYLDPMLPIDGIGATAVGMFMHNSTVKDLGLYKVGLSIGNIIPLPGRGGNTTQGGGLL